MKLISFLTFITIAFPQYTVVASELSEVSPKVLAKGESVFLMNCVACHGPKGDGRGPAAKAISGPKPRDFTTGEYKYGDSAEKVFKTISNGVPQSAMPSWNSLPEDERWAVTYYIKTLSKK